MFLHSLFVEIIFLKFVIISKFCFSIFLFMEAQADLTLAFYRKRHSNTILPCFNGECFNVRFVFRHIIKLLIAIISVYYQLMLEASITIRSVESFLSGYINNQLI